MDILAVIVLTVSVLGGAALIVGGFIRRHAVPSPRNVHKRAVWWAAQLDEWGLHADSVVRTGVGADLQRCFRILHSYTMVWGGATLIVTAVGYAALSLRVAGVIQMPPIPTLLDAVMFGPFILAGAVGYLRGIQHLRRAQAAVRSYGDLRPRRTADYRSPLFPLATVLLIVWVALASALVSAHAGALLRLNPYGPSTTLPARWWVFAFLPATMAIFALVLEVLIRRVTELPRMLMSPNVEGAWRADELLRSRQINVLQTWQWTIVGYLATAQVSVLSWNVGQSGAYPAQRQPLFVVLYLCATFMPAVGMFLLACQGRLGGRVTGWPWRHRTA